MRRATSLMRNKGCDARFGDAADEFFVLDTGPGFL
jgi:hypothetical protein